MYMCVCLCINVCVYIWHHYAVYINPIKYCMSAVIEENKIKNLK